MASPVTLTMSEIIDETMDYMHRYSERPAMLTVGTTALTDSSTTLTLDLGAASLSDVVEFGQELVLVTGKTADAVPVYTVARGYLGTTPVVQATGTVGGLNPMYPRYQVQRAIVRFFAMANAHLPNVQSDTFAREAGSQVVVLPDDVIRVVEVGVQSPWGVFENTTSTPLRYTPIGGWAFFEDLPPQSTITGKQLRTPAWVQDDQELVVKYIAPYRWFPTPVTEASTIGMPHGGEDLPVLFATARLVSGREISRSELDKVEEWNQEAAIRGGVNLRLVRSLWQDFYQRVQEVQGVQYVPRHRPYRKMNQLLSYRTVAYR